MGLTIHYHLTTTTGDEAQARKLVQQLRQAALDLPFQHVGEIVELRGDQCDWEQRPDDDPYRWLLVQAGTHIALPVEPWEKRQGVTRHLDVRPLHVIAFETEPGDGCEAANFGLCQYPGEVSDPGFGRHQTKLKGWSWRSFCKTHYASDPRCGGLPNFLRCHLGVVALLDEAQRLGILWVTCEAGGALRAGVEELLAWQAVADDANRGLLGELEPHDIRGIQRELNDAKGQIEDRVWSSYNHLLLWDASTTKLKDIVLGQLHPSEARSITSAILARLRHDSLLSREIGASYIERNWPPALKESGTWPLASLKAAFFQGQFTRLEKADDALKVTITRAVSQGMLGLASGKDANCFDRVWFKEAVEAAEITFDYDTYLLTAVKAKALKQGAPPLPTVPPLQPPIQPPLQPGTPPATPPVPPVARKPTVVVWEGELKREQWNLFSLKVLTRLAQSDDLQIDVKVKATLKEGQTTDQLNSALKELGIQEGFRRT
jgi:hypothetical protein